MARGDEEHLGRVPALLLILAFLLAAFQAPAASTPVSLNGHLVRIGAGAGPNEKAPSLSSVSTARAVPHPAQASLPANWSKLCAGASPYNCVPQPSARRGPALTWDSVDGYAVLFGGSTAVGSGLLNDSWKFKHGVWTQLTSGPSTLVARSNATLTFDTADGYGVMFGGYSGTGGYSSQTWKFLAGSWTLLTPASSPQPSAPSCMVYVPAVTGHGGYVLLFGGKGKPGAGASAYYGYTWEFSAGSWTNVTSSVGTSPTARGYSQCAYDAADGYVLLFGGINATALQSDTWEFNPQSSTTGSWSHLTPSTSPEARFEGAMAYVSSVSGTYLACGAYGTLTTPTLPGGGCSTWQWISGSTTWTNVSSSVGFGTNGIGQPKSGYDAGWTDLPGYSYSLRADGYTGAVANSSYAFGNVLQVTLGASNGETYVGGALTLYANASGGAGPFAFVWGSLPSSCSSANASVIQCQPGAAGSFGPFTAKLTGTDGFNVTATGISLLVDSVQSVSGLLSIGNATGAAPSFFGTDLTPRTLNQSTISTVAALANATPFRTFRYGYDADALNVTNTTSFPLGCAYFGNNVCVANINNYSLFATFCQWTKAQCIVTLPTQVNDPGLVAITVRYIEQTDHFHPIYNLGNEPTTWTHFNKPYRTWSTTDNVAPTAAQYNKLVQNDTRAIFSVDPSAQIVGLTDAATGGSLSPFNAANFQTFYATNGANLSGMDFHTYSATGEAAPKVPSEALSYANTVAAAGLYKSYLAGMVAGCGTCPASLSIGEYNTGGSGNPFPGTLVSGIGAAANAALLLSLGAPMFSYYDFYDTAASGLAMVNSGNNTPSAAYFVYSDVLRYLPTATISNASVASSMRGVWAVMGSTASTEGVLIVNTNTSVSLSLAVGQPFGSQVETTYSFGRSGVGPAQTYTTEQSTVTVGAESAVVLLYSHAPVPPAVSTSGSTSPGLFFLAGQTFVWVAEGGVIILAVISFAVASRKGQRR